MYLCEPAIVCIRRSRIPIYQKKNINGGNCSGLLRKEDKIPEDSNLTIYEDVNYRGQNKFLLSNISHMK